MRIELEHSEAPPEEEGLAKAQEAMQAMGAASNMGVVALDIQKRKVVIIAKQFDI